MNATSLRALVIRSVMPGVGRPPDQNSASIDPSFMPSTVLVRSNRCAATSVCGSRPAACSSRLAITSVPEPGDPVDTRLPRMSAIEVMPLPVRAITWV